MNGTRRSGFAGAFVAHAKRHSLCCPIGRHHQGSTASTAGKKHGSCCANQTVPGSDLFRMSQTRRGRPTHRQCDAGPDACCIWGPCWRRSSGRLAVGVSQRLPPSFHEKAIKSRTTWRPSLKFFFAWSPMPRADQREAHSISPTHRPPFPDLSPLRRTARSGQGRAAFARRSVPLTTRTVLKPGA